MTTETLQPRIYVACLASYNEGRLHGAWIDADQSPDEIWAEIKAMLATSKALLPEEIAIHDHEGFGGYRLGEYEAIADVAALAAGLVEHGLPLAAYLNYTGVSIEEALDGSFEESYVGTFASEREFAEETVGELGWAGVPAGKLYGDRYGGYEIDVFDALWGVLDWEHIAREMFMGDYFSADLGSEIAVFRSY